MLKIKVCSWWHEAKSPAACPEHEGGLQGNEKIRGRFFLNVYTFFEFIIQNSIALFCVSKLTSASLKSYTDYANGDLVSPLAINSAGGHTTRLIERPRVIFISSKLPCCHVSILKILNFWPSLTSHKCQTQVKQVTGLL